MEQVFPFRDISMENSRFFTAPARMCSLRHFAHTYKNKFRLALEETKIGLLKHKKCHVFKLIVRPSSVSSSASRKSKSSVFLEKPLKRFNFNSPQKAFHESLDANSSKLLTLQVLRKLY